MAPKSLPERLWSLQETAQFLGLPAQTLYQHVSKGTAPRSFRVGRYRRFDPADVRAWLERQASDAEPAAR